MEESLDSNKDFNPYAILNIPRNASSQQIQESYLRFSKTFHPDRQARSNMSEDALQASQEQFVRITRAKTILLDAHLREAYDCYGMSGVNMLEKGINSHAELRSWQVGKEYRNETRISDLLRYYMKREASIELDKLVSSYGHVELECDASGVYEEVIDTIFRRQTIPQFWRNIWFGIPQINIVVQPDGTIAGFESLAGANGMDANGMDALDAMDSVDADEEFEGFQGFEPLDLFGTGGQAAEGDDDYIEYESEEDLSMAELMNKSIEDQVAIITEALKSGDVSQLRNVPITRDPVRPKMSSFLINLSHQCDLDHKNTLVVGASQYLSLESQTSSGGAARLFHSIETEWQHQYSQRTKFVTGFSCGSSSLGSRFSVSRNLDERTWLDVGINVNFLDESWQSLINSITYGGDGSVPDSVENEDAADVIGSMFDSDDTPSAATHQKKTSFINVIPELFWLLKAGLGCVWNGASFVTKNLARNSGGLYPGFDLKFSIKRLLFDQWLGTTSVKLGRSPTFDIEMKKQIGLKHWTYGLDLGQQSIGLSMKHVSQITPRVRWFIKVNLDFINLLKLEFGLSRTLTDEHVHLSTSEMHGIAADETIFYGSNIDVRAVGAVSASVTQGLHLHIRAARGPSQFNVPILLSSSLKLRNLLVAFSVPVFALMGYKKYLKRQALRAKSSGEESQLNERGRMLRNKRMLALNQQQVMLRTSEKNVEIESKKDGKELIILAAVYGKNINQKVASGIRSYLNLDGWQAGGKNSANSGKPKYHSEADASDGADAADAAEDDASDSETESEDEQKNAILDDEQWARETNAGPPPLFLNETLSVGNVGNDGSNGSNRNNGNERNRRDRRSNGRNAAEDEKDVNVETGESKDDDSEENGVKLDGSRVYLSQLECVRECQRSGFDSSKIIKEILKDPIIDNEEDMLLPSWIDVSVVLRYMMRNGELKLMSGTKTSLPGFYDCAPQNFANKELFVIYQYDGNVYCCNSLDLLPMNLPNSVDLQWIDCNCS